MLSLLVGNHIRKSTPKGKWRAGNETLLVTPSVSPLLSSLRTAGRKREDRLKSKTREIALERQIHFMSRV